MPSFKDAFPSKYLKAEDLGATRHVGTIDTVQFEDVGTGDNLKQKLVVTFRESRGPLTKGLVLNLVNSETIAEIAGTEDYTAWPGTRILLFAAKTDFQGKRVPCIRIDAPPPPAKPAPARPAGPVARRVAPEPPHPADLPEADGDPDNSALDDIPF